MVADDDDDDVGVWGSLSFPRFFEAAKTETCPLSLVMTGRNRYHKKCRAKAQRTVLAALLLPTVFGFGRLSKKK
jgi:hypothetical protein